MVNLKNVLILLSLSIIIFYLGRESKSPDTIYTIKTDTVPTIIFKKIIKHDTIRKWYMKEAKPESIYIIKKDTVNIEDRQNIILTLKKRNLDIYAQNKAYFYTLRQSHPRLSIIVKDTQVRVLEQMTMPSLGAFTGISYDYRRGNLTPDIGIFIKYKRIQLCVTINDFKIIYNF